MNTSSSSPTGRRAARWSLIFLFGVVSLTLAIGGYEYYRQQTQAIHTERYNELKAIAELKIAQIVQWRQERVADARINSTGSVRIYLLQWLASPADDALKTALLERLRLYADLEGYRNMILAAADGRLLLSLDPRLTTLEAPTQQLAGQAVASGQIVFGDFFRSPDSNQIYLDVAAPILDENRRPVAVLVLRVDPEQYLYPLIQTWPTPSQSAETLLLRRDGEDVLFLNALRHIADPALTLRIPLTRTEVPAVQAVLGRTGEFQGRDYRGVEVLAEIQPVPGTPWFMIAKVDTGEILAEARYRGQVILFLVALAIVMTGVLAALVYTHRQQRLTQELLRAEQARRQAQEETRATLYSIGDGVIATDAAGCVTRMNPVAEALTGRREAEALGKPLEQVFHIINEDTRVEVENPVARVLREGVVVGLANHSLLIARDGIERPIADSGAPIRDEQGRVAGVVLVFRDQTEERALQKALAEGGEIYRIVADYTYDWEYWQSPDGKLVYVSPSCERITGYRAEEFMQAPGLLTTIMHPDDRHVLEQHKHILLQDGDAPEVHQGDFRIFRRDGETCWIGHACQIVRRRDGTFLGIRASNREITERKQAEEALHESEMRFRSLYENTSIGLYRTTVDGRILMANPALIEMLGYESFAQLAQRNLAEEGFAHDYPRREFQERIVRDGEIRGLESAWMRRDGSTIFVRESARLMRDESDQPIYYEGTAEDITERKRTEAQLNEQLDELRRWHAATLGRETRILDLKAEVNELLAKAGQPPRYPSAKEAAHG